MRRVCGGRPRTRLSQGSAAFRITRLNEAQAINMRVIRTSCTGTNTRVCHAEKHLFPGLVTLSTTKYSSSLQALIKTRHSTREDSVHSNYGYGTRVDIISLLLFSMDTCCAGCARPSHDSNLSISMHWKMCYLWPRRRCWVLGLISAHRSNCPCLLVTGGPASVPMTVHSTASLPTEPGLKSALQASPLHPGVLHRTWPIFYRR